VKTVASAGNSKTEAEAAHLKVMSTFCSEELAVGGIGCWKNWLFAKCGHASSKTVFELRNLQNQPNIVSRVFHDTAAAASPTAPGRTGEKSN